MIELITTSPQDTIALGQQVSELLGIGHVISLKGPLGSGKTTFTKGIGLGLGIERAIKSPTYTIVKEYELDRAKGYLYHIDAYRLEGASADTVDIDSFITPSALTVIEWAEFIEEYLPRDYLIVELQAQEGNQRRIRISPSVPESRYATLIQDLERK